MKGYTHQNIPLQKFPEQNGKGPRENKTDKNYGIELQIIRLGSSALLLLLSISTFAVKKSVGTEVHDVAITYVDVGRPIVGIWRHSDIDITVQNFGNVSETFQVTAYATRNSDNVTFTIDSATIQDLAPGQTDYLLFYWPWPTLTIALFPPPWAWPPDEPLVENFTVWAEAEVPNDFNLSNNIYINGNITVILWVIDVAPPDGHIDIRDIAAVARAFGSYPSHPTWNPYVDFNSDEKIDIRDVAASAKYFGQSY